jgi:predicted neuraminidase
VADGPRAAQRLKTSLPAAVLFGLAAILIVAAGARAGLVPSGSPGFVPTAPAPLADLPPVDDYLVRPPEGIVHVASAVPLPDGRLAAFWYQGSDEAAPDVTLQMAVAGDGGWSPAETLVAPVQLGRQTRRYVHFIGNATVFRHPAGDYWLFVSSGFGGWSTGQITLLRSADGRDWRLVRRLHADPFLNIGMLVKGPPLALADGGVALPVYNEMAGISHLLFVDGEGRVTGRSRLGAGGHGTQPWVVASSPTEAVALLRDAGRDVRRAWRTATTDGGATWAPLVPTEVENPDSPVAMVPLAGGRLLMVGNDTPERATTLVAAVSSDQGLTWQRTRALFSANPEIYLFRYPWLASDGAGQLHLLVTEYYEQGLRGIRHVTLGPEIAGEPDGP